MPTALVLDGSSGPALSIVRSLGRAGWRVLVQAGTRSARSRFTDVAVRIPDAGEDPAGFAKAVADFLTSAAVDVVVPCTDAAAEILWGEEALLGGARILGGNRSSFELCSDKLRTLEAADAFGFPTPRWFQPPDLQAAAKVLAELPLPAVAKSRRSYTRVGRRLEQHRFEFVSSAEELAGWYAAGLGPILQEYVPGRSISVSVVLREGELLAAVAREAYSFLPVRGGTSVWKRTVALDEPGVELALRFLREIDYEGLGELEFQLDETDTPRLMEINARAHGWIGLAVAAGVDLPLIAARALLGDPVGRRPDYRVGVEMRWPAGELLRLRAALSRSPGLPPDSARRDVVAGLWPPWRGGMHYDGLDITDLGPWISSLAGRSRRRRDPR